MCSLTIETIDKVYSGVGELVAQQIVNLLVPGSSPGAVAIFLNLFR